MKKSVNQLRTELQEIAVAHDQINSFFWGDLLRAVSESEVTYPLMQCLYPTATLLNNQTQLSLNISIYDKIFKDWTVNLNDVESDTLQICRDIFNIINSSTRWQKIGRVDSCTVQKFIDATSDEIVGHMMTILFTVRDTSGVCDLPMTGYDYDQSTGASLCEDGTYEIYNSAGTLIESGTVASGGSVSETITDSTYLVEYLNGTPIESGTIPAEGSVLVQVPNPADATYTITDDSANVLYSGTIPSGGNLNQVIQDSTVTITDDSANTLYTLSVNSEGSASQVIADSTAVLKTTSNVTISTTSINAQASADITAPDTSIEVNGVSEGLVVAGSTVDIQLSDSLGVVTALSVTQTGNDFAVVLPDAPPSVTRSTATLMKTGQQTSFRTGDDGDLEAGRATDFLTLDAAPVHNDGSATINLTPNRFTDTLGGQTYANNIVLDWSTWDGSTLLGYDRTDRSGLNTDNSIDACLLLSVGGFTGYRLVNFNELCNLWNKSRTSLIDYPPFNHGTGFRRYLSSTTVPSSTSSVYILQQVGVTPATLAKTTGSAFDIHIAVRTFSLSTSNVLS